MLSFLVPLAVVLSFAPASAAAATSTERCQRAAPPDWFQPSVARAVAVSGDLPSSWATSPYVARIVCRQGSGFDPTFSRAGDRFHVWHGLFAMTTEELQTIAGPWMIRDRNGLQLSAECFLDGWDSCPHKRGYTRTAQQTIAGLRWVWLQYGTPKAAWNHIVSTGRFNSLPRAGDTATKSPLRLCPVAGRVVYRDDFGIERTIGGYHPHWGNDIRAPRGREIRAPFAGLAVGHSDGWFGGNYVTVVGAKGYVRNGHLERFGTLGYVDAGTVIGYVGDSGDASSTHDHFEWHPWVVPTPLHEAPSGFSRIMDAIDPYPFLNRVCG
jgi:Peptidase family M23